MPLRRRATGPGPAGPTRPAFLAVLLALVAALALAAPALAADEPAEVPAAVVQPLGAQTAAVVPYRQLVGAADARNLNAAVVDTSSYWVAAIDRGGKVIAAQIPKPQPGRDFAQATTPGAVAGKAGAAGACRAPSTWPRTCAATASPS